VLENGDYMMPNNALHRAPDASVTRLARATRAPLAGAGELTRYASLNQPFHAHL
jgi:hypothetical protein